MFVYWEKLSGFLMMMLMCMIWGSCWLIGIVVLVLIMIIGIMGILVFSVIWVMLVWLW